ncbi:MAG: M60 family metallopeptidase [bacterium]
MKRFFKLMTAVSLLLTVFACSPDDLLQLLPVEDNQSPILSFTHPRAGTVSPNIGVVVEASDPDGTISKVALYINGEFVRHENAAPYEWGTANNNSDDPLLLNCAPGSYQLRAVAIDNDGNKTSATLSVTVEDDGNGDSEDVPSDTTEGEDDGDSDTTIDSDFDSDEAEALSSALDKLHRHITVTSTLNPSQIAMQEEAVSANDMLFETNKEMIAAALEVVAAYESSRGPLWLNDTTRNVTIPREPQEGFELEYAIIAVMQGLLDHAYVPGNLARYREILDGALFETSEYFPGAVDPPADPSVSYDVTINAAQTAKWGSPVMYDDDPVRRPTGCYVAPGSIVTVDVPASLVDKGYAIRVGAHSWDLSNKPRYERLDRVSLLYPITATRTFVGNPLGGGIYIEVPPLADAGIATITITNAVRSPFYSKKPFHMTSLSEWRDTERHYPGPWADFESEQFMMQVPTNWIYAYDSPDITMEKWDKAMDLVSDLMGKPRIRNGQTVLYMQIDVIIRGGAYYPGYPMSNDPYDPLRNENGNKNHYFLTGPGKGTSTTFHELGHAELFTKFPGEVEAVVNFLYVAVMNRGFDFSLDRAFSLSIGNKEQISLDQAAVMWMVTENFRQGNPMDITNSTTNEVRYQHRGYGKYAEIANLFGWDALNDFWRSVNVDYMNGITYNRNNDEADSRILRMSRTAGADLRPLIHFWGVHPNNDKTLKAAMQSEGLMPSALIYDRLMHYQTLIPMNNAEFVAHADVVYPERDGTGDPDYGKGWYSVWEELYNESHGTAAQAALQEIIDHYFPNGRPSF